MSNELKRGLSDIINIAPVIASSSKSFPSYYSEDDTKDGKTILAEMGDVCKVDFDTDLASRQPWAENVSKIIKLFASYSDPKTFPWPNCYSLDTEVLTSSGWKCIGDIKKGELVFTRNPNGAGLFREVTNTYIHSSDAVIHFEGKSIDLIVTPDHNMYCETLAGKTKLIPAADLINNPGANRIPLTSYIYGKTPEKVYGIDTKAYLRFLGWYVSEGHACYGYQEKQKVTTSSFFISQSITSNKSKCDILENDIASCGFTFSKSDRGYIIHAKSMPIGLKDELRSLGNTCYEKHLPPHIFGYVDLLPELIKTLIAGDGSIRVKDNGKSVLTYYTTSKMLADQLQIIAQFIGIRATITKRDSTENVSFIRGESVSSKAIGYSISFCSKNKIKVNTLKYTLKDWGYAVACIEVPPYHCIYVRRNGKAVWCGNCSNVRLPVITISCIQFHARAYQAMFPGKDVVKILSTGDEDVNRAQRVQQYMNWQVLYKMKEFQPGMDKTLLQASLVGSVFKKTYFSFEKRRPMSIYVSANDLVFPYYTQDFDSASRKSHVLYLTKNDIRKRVKAGLFIQDAWNLGPGSKILPQTDIQNAKDDVQGTMNTSSWYDVPRIFIEQHRDWDLDGDGIQEPYVITVDYETRMVVRITTRSFIDAFGQNQDIEYFTPYTFLPNPEGCYAFGLGTLLLGLNESMNSILNEIIDAGTVANLLGGFVSKRSGIKKGDLKFAMGEWKEVDTFIDDISKALYTFDFKGPSNTLYATLGLLYEYAKLVSSVSETMTGALPASDTPAATVLALLEEGRKVYSGIHERLHVSFGDELKKIYTLNSIFLSEMEYFKVLGDKNVPIGPNEMVGKGDFIGDYDIIPVSDPKIISQAEKVLKAQQLVSDVRANPLTANNADANFAATKRYYEALDIDNLDEILKPPSPPPDVPPEQENADMLLEKMATVLPEQDHLHHIDVHDSFLNSPIYGPELSPNAKNLLERHNKEHLAAMYLQEVQYGSQGMAPAGNNQEGY